MQRRLVAVETDHAGSIVVGGKALNGSKSFAAAASALIDERKLWSVAVVSGDHRFSGDRHFVERTVAEIDKLLGMPIGEIRNAGHVACIRARGCKAASKNIRHLAEVYRPSPVAIPRRLKIAVPATRR